MSTTKTPLERLAAICSNEPLAEKILVVPVMNAGRHLTDALLGRGEEWINIRVETVGTLARSLTASMIASEGLDLISRAQSLALVERACLEALGDDSYFAELHAHPGFHRAMAWTIADLRRTGVSADELRRGRLEDPAKKSEIIRVAARYEKLLNERKLTDLAGVMRRALDLLESEGSPPRYAKATWMVATPLEELDPDERALIERLSDGEYILLQPEDRAGHDQFGQAAVVAADSFENEIRHLLRSVPARGLSWDQVEIACLEGAGLEPLLYELLAEHGVDATWEQGISVRFTRPGRAVLGFLEWIRRGYDAVLLRRLLGAGVIDTGEVGSRRAARLLRAAGIGWGRDRYGWRLDSLVRELRHRRAESEGEGVDEELIARAEELGKILRSVIEITPDSSVRELTVSQMASLAARFNEERSRVASEIDADARAAITRVLGEISELESASAIPIEESVSRLIGIVDEIRVGIGHASPGAVHVATVAGAGWSDRALLAIPALNESVFPGGGTQDPILLDHERVSINRVMTGRELPLPGALAQRRDRDLRRLLRRFEGELIASCSTGQTVTPGREAPAAILLDIYRASRDGDAGFDRMRRELETRLVSSVPPVEEGVPANVSESWLRLWKSRGGAGEKWTERVASTSGMVSAGWRASRAREEGESNAWNGILPGTHPELDPRETGEPVSASRLETLSSCPYRFFLKYVLRVKPVEELSRDPDVWLEPREYGTLVHEVFRSLMTEIMSRDETPSWEAHAALAKEIADHELEKLRTKIPPPNQAAWRSRVDELNRACEIFLREEETSSAERRPFAFEVAFGWEAEDPRKIGSMSPVEISTGSGSFHLRGQIDRIDQLPGGGWEVIDYKSGSPGPYAEDSWLAKGKRLQHALYARAGDILLAGAGYEGRVSRSGYYFPTVRGQGRRVVKEVPLPEEESGRDLDEKLRDLFEVLSQGAFLHSLSEEDCRFCDFKEACGSIEWSKNELLLPGLAGPGVDAWKRVRESEED